MGVKTEDLTGKKFNSWVVLGIGKPSSRGISRWRSKCVCGYETDHERTNLSKVESCGCVNRRRIRERIKHQFLYGHLRRSASSRSLSLEITLEQFLEFTKAEVCHYCGDKLFWSKYTRDGVDGKARYGYNLDRKDSSQGYTLANVVPCCSRCNMGKNERYTYDEWVAVGKRLAVLYSKVKSHSQLSPS